MSSNSKKLNPLTTIYLDTLSEYAAQAPKIVEALARKDMTLGARTMALTPLGLPAQGKGASQARADAAQSMLAALYTTSEQSEQSGDHAPSLES